MTKTQATKTVLGYRAVESGAGIRLVRSRKFRKNKKRKEDKMTSRDFCYWLQGLFELQNPEQLDAEQTEAVKRHLSMVFKHEIDPSFPDAETLSVLHKMPTRSSKRERTEPRSDRNRPIMC